MQLRRFGGDGGSESGEELLVRDAAMCIGPCHGRGVTGAAVGEPPSGGVQKELMRKGLEDSSSSSSSSGIVEINKYYLQLAQKHSR